MSDIERTVRELKRTFNVSWGQPSAKTENGTKYVTITSGGLKEEGKPTPAWFSSERKAIECWFREVIDYYNYCVSKDKKNLVWRVYPEIQKTLRIIDSDMAWEFYTVRARLAFE